jgi:serine protease Do
VACAETKIPYLGIEWQLRVRDDASTQPQDGVVVNRVISDSPARKAGISEGDIIQSVDGIAIGDEHTITRLIMRHKPGSVIALSLLRGGKRVNVKVTLGSRVIPVLKFAPVAYDG